MIGFRNVKAYKFCLIKIRIEAMGVQLKATFFKTGNKLFAFSTNAQKNGFVILIPVI
jgi:hypothetical protein